MRTCFAAAFTAKRGYIDPKEQASHHRQSLQYSQEKIARIEWSSSHYDYMVVQDEKLLPVNTEGNSVFEVQVSVFDEAIPITADTTAMSIPHEIEYTLTFASASVRPAKASDKKRRDPDTYRP